MESDMNIGIVGDGPRCEFLIEFIQQSEFPTMRPRVVALANDRVNAPCVVGRSRYAAVKNLKMVYNFQRCPIPGTTKTKGGIP